MSVRYSSCLMEKWESLVAVVTGASSGIGQAIAVRLAKEGMKVAALARRESKLQDLTKGHYGKGEVRAYCCDVTDDKMVSEVLGRVQAEMGAIRVLVNNAGVALYTSLTDIDLPKWRRIFDVNVFGLMSCTKVVLDSVKRKDPGPVHIINVNSILGHSPFCDSNVMVYSASKHCITLLTRALIKQIAENKLNVKFTSLSPGFVETEILDVGEWQANHSVWPMLHSDDIAEAAISILRTPPHVIISELTIKSKGEIF